MGRRALFVLTNVATLIAGPIELLARLIAREKYTLAAARAALTRAGD